ncbi:MAG: hypothetical protein JJT77_02100 [Crocinitomicaceae bacterium]|nr:hypothetical protein [Crocinitomicaceae bacterium]
MGFNRILSGKNRYKWNCFVMIRGGVFLVVYLFLSFGAFSQRKEKPQNYFGFQFRPLIPLNLVGDRPFDMIADEFETTVSSRFGYSYGGVIRAGVSRQISIETGINYTKRNYGLDFRVPDSNLTAFNTVGFVNYDIPANLLVYIMLDKNLYMNTSLGGSLNFYPSNVRTIKNIEGTPHLFILEGRRAAFFSTDLNANVGFEYRTEKNGIFYLGISGKLPLQPIFLIATEYRNDTYRKVAIDLVDGATFSIDLKYFFHKPPKKGIQYHPGIIEQ